MATQSGFVEQIAVDYSAHHGVECRVVEWDHTRANNVVKAHVTTYGNVDGGGTSGGWSIRAALVLMDANELALCKAQWPYHSNAIQRAYDAANGSN